MHRLVSRLPVLLLLALMGAVAGHLVANASMGGEEPRGLFSIFDAALGGGEYEFSELKLLDRTRYFVEDKYVEPSRIDPEEMLEGALSFVERQIPEVLFRRSANSRLLHVSVGTQTTTLEFGKVGDLESMAEELRRVASFLDANLDSSIERPEVEYAFINGMLSSLDPHTVLLPPEISKEMEVENQGEFGGLGITITIDKGDGWLTIEYPLQDTPAFRVGLKARDKILRIEDESTLNMDLQEAVSKLRGPVGEPVTITVNRESFDEPREFTIVRDKIRINPVSGELLEGGVGYIKIKGFHATTARDLETQLASFKRANNGSLRGLVLDLRANPGGYLHQAVEVSDRFLSDGVVVVTVEEGRREEKRARSSNTEPDYPIVVLINANSASASEIVAGALKNNQRAVIVGDRSFGKGSVQNLYPNGDDSRLKLTVAKYLTPGDRSIQSLGITPDIRLVPSIIDDGRFRKNADESTPIPSVAMYWTDRLSREEDLDDAFDEEALNIENSNYQVRYLRELVDPDRPRSDSLDLDSDWEVQFSRDLILSVSSARRADMLVTAAEVTARHQRVENARIVRAFRDVGLDWADVEQPEDVKLHVAMDLGEEGVLEAAKAKDEILSVHVTNMGDEPVHRVLASTSSSQTWLDGQEFYFGKIQPGETRSWSQKVRRVDGYTDEVASVKFMLRDVAGRALGESEKLVRLVGQPLPKFSFSFELIDGGFEGTSGDSDGIAEDGEDVLLRTTVYNVGKGDSEEGFAKLRNLSGRRIDLKVGTVDLGDVTSSAETQFDFEFAIRPGTIEPEVDFSVGENTRYDYTAVVRGGFYSFATQSLSVELGGDSPVESGRHTPPSLEISRRPELVVSSSRAVISGLVRDDSGVRDVMVFQGEEKVFYQGGGEGVGSVPFSVEAELEEGGNTFVVLARDDEGLTDIRSINVMFDPTGERVARLNSEEVTTGSKALQEESSEGD